MSRFGDMREAVQADCRRLQEYLGVHHPLTRRHYVRLALRVEVLPLLLYRVSHYLHLQGRYGLANLVYRINLLVTGSDIHPASQIGSGCLMMHPVGSVVAATIGTNASLHAMVVIAAETPLVNLKDAPRLGDNVTVHTGVTILGGVEIANNAKIAPNSLIQRSMTAPSSAFDQVPNEQTSTQIFREGET